MRKINERQRTILKALCAYLLATTIFPPFHLEYPGGVNRGLGYGFLFSPPSGGEGMVSATQLAVEWILGISVSAIAIYMANNWVADDTTPSIGSRLRPAIREGFRRSKHLIWVFFGMFVVSLLAAISGGTEHRLRAAGVAINAIIFFLVAWIWHTYRSYHGIQGDPKKPNTLWSSIKRIALALLIFIAIGSLFIESANNPLERNWNSEKGIPKAFDDLIPEKGK